MFDPSTPQSRFVLRTRSNKKYLVELSFYVDTFYIGVFRRVREKLKWLRSRSCERKVRRASIVQYHKRVVRYIIGQEKWNQMVDEIGGFLGNHDWQGAKTLSAMAKDSDLKRWAWYYDAIEEDILEALITIQREDGVLQDYKVGSI